jgi:glycosyltransferase involved in cell wall biosynthesis
MRLGFVTWSDTSPTGGNRYNDELVAALRRIGVAVTVVRVEGPWPAGSAQSHRVLAEALASKRLVLVDGVVASCAPEVIAKAPSGVVVLVHMSIADDLGLDQVVREAYARAESRSLHAAAGVICPSEHSRRRLVERYGLPHVSVARPGARSGPLATGSEPPRLLSVGAVTPVKDQLTLLKALGTLTDLPWTLRLVGSLQAAPRYADAVRAAAASFGERLQLTGVLTGSSLAQEWDEADLLLHTAEQETFGLVVTEALAHGIPALVRAGTGAAEALGGSAGSAVHPSRLGPELRRWLQDPGRRAAWRQAARVRRLTLPGWDQTARQVLAALRRSGSYAG